MAKSLMECTNPTQVGELPRDNFTKDFYSLVRDGSTVWLSEQHPGDSPAQQIEIPKTTFDSLVKKYMRPQKG